MLCVNYTFLGRMKSYVVIFITESFHKLSLSFVVGVTGVQQVQLSPKRQFWKMSKEHRKCDTFHVKHHIKANRRRLRLEADQSMQSVLGQNKILLTYKSANVGIGTFILPSALMTIAPNPIPLSYWHIIRYNTSSSRVISSGTSSIKMKGIHRGASHKLWLLSLSKVPGGFW